MDKKYKLISLLSFPVTLNYIYTTKIQIKLFKTPHLDERKI